MSVGVGGKSDGGVTEKVHHGSQLLALVQEECRERMSQIMKAYPVEAGCGRAPHQIVG